MGSFADFGHRHLEVRLTAASRHRQLGHSCRLSATSGRSEPAACVRSKIKTVLKLWSSARYRATRRADSGGTVMPTPPSASGEYRGSSAARLCKGKCFNSEIISSMMTSLIYDSSRRATRLDRVCDRQHLQGEHL